MSVPPISDAPTLPNARIGAASWRTRTYGRAGARRTYGTYVKLGVAVGARGSPQPVHFGGDPDPGRDVHLGEHAGQVRLDRPDAEEEPLGDLLVAASLGDELGDLVLARRQPERQLLPALAARGPAGRRHPDPEAALLPGGLRLQPPHPARAEDLRGGADPLPGAGAVPGGRERDPG